MQVYTCGGGSMVYFIVNIYYKGTNDKGEYEDYIKKVKPLAESYGGKYIIRSDKVTPLSDKWKPDRMIIIQWENRESLIKCFNSDEYKEIEYKRTDSVDSRAVILEE